MLSLNQMAIHLPSGVDVWEVAVEFVTCAQETGAALSASSTTSHLVLCATSVIHPVVCRYM